MEELLTSNEGLEIDEERRGNRADREVDVAD
jgi:hypothetical protein